MKNLFIVILIFFAPLTSAQPILPDTTSLENQLQILALQQQQTAEKMRTLTQDDLAKGERLQQLEKESRLQQQLIDSLHTAQQRLLDKLRKDSASHRALIESLAATHADFRNQQQKTHLRKQQLIDSLSVVTTQLHSTQSSSKQNVDSQLSQTNESLRISQHTLDMRTLWGIIVLVFILLLIILIVYLFARKINRGNSSIDEVRKAQESMRAAQEKMQEESVKLDSKLLEIAEKQLEAVEGESNASGAPDHTLIVKLADEIARIETNLSKMDKSVRGYKQLVQAKDRMINNVRANGYEIISLIGQEYNDGMQFQTRFVPDDSLPEGTRIISGMIKMQVNYNGKMIQPAQIVVSQNI